MPKHWIQKALPKSSKGKLHRELHVPAGKKIGAAKLAKAAKTAKKTHNSKLGKRVSLARTLSGFRKTGGRKHG